MKDFRFEDGGTPYRWAALTLPSGDPCWIEVASTGVLVKVSTNGAFGRLLFGSHKQAELVRLGDFLDTRFEHVPVPPGGEHPLFRAVVRCALACHSIAELRTLLTIAAGRSPDAARQSEHAPESFSESSPKSSPKSSPRTTHPRWHFLTGLVTASAAAWVT